MPRVNKNIKAAATKLLALIPNVGTEVVFDSVTNSGDVACAYGVVRAPDPISGTKLYKAAKDAGYGRDQRQGELKIIIDGVQFFYNDGPKVDELKFYANFWK